jgi:hypothetical protein
MNEQNMMTNDEVMEVAEVMPTSSGNGLKVIGGLAVVGGLIYGGYRLIRKLRSKKSDGVIDVDSDSVKVEDCDVENIG